MISRRKHTRRIFMVSTLFMVLCSGSQMWGHAKAIGRVESVSSQAFFSPVPAVREPDNDPDAKWPNFPATCALQPNQGPPNCTCVLVGPRAVLTARHCVKSETEANDPDRIWKRQILVFRKEGTFSGDCSVAPDVDLALCVLTGPNPVSGINFENLGKASANQKKLLLTGFGCREFIEPNAPSKFSSRRIEVENLPNNSKLIETGNLLLCPRDSGGPGYILLADQLKGARLVVGINAKNSKLTRVSAPEASKFIEFRRNGVRRQIQICGINTPAGTRGCRSLS